MEKSMSGHTIWVEKYRPDNLENYIGNETLKEKFAQYIETQDIPHLLFYGTAGTGKTTAAKILMKNIDCDALMINASDERGIDVIRDKIKNFASTSGFAPLKIVFLDEADYLTPDAQAALRNMMEVFSNKTRFILTCNYVERIIPAIVSRCQTSAVTPPSKKDVAIHLTNVLGKENVTFEKQDVVTLVNAYYPDIRRIIGSAQQQTRDGKLKVNVNEIISGDSKLQIMDTLMSNKTSAAKMNEIRQIVVDAGIKDYTELYTLLYSKVADYAPNKIPETVIAIAEGQFQDSFVVDKEICFMATLYKILM
jgi:DNA polymerase III delta prime subunit